MTLKDGSCLQGGKYRIERVLGQGGFGITYAAIQTGLNRRVAIKEFFMKDVCERNEATSDVTVPTQASRALVNRFRQKFLKEARTIAEFDHPNIVTIHDVFEENGTAYYVMRYAEGGSLSDLLKRQGPLSEAEAVRYVQQVASALQYIHERRVNHLDVKPGNIMLDRKGKAMLIDFGLSKQYDQAGEQTSSTPVGKSRGYAAMEQYREGGVAEFSPTTDIYALGATLYKLVTGQTPPDAHVVGEEGVPPMPDAVSPAISRAVFAAMQPRRKDRPQSVADFVALLEARGERREISGERREISGERREARGERASWTGERLAVRDVSSDEETQSASSRQGSAGGGSSPSPKTSSPKISSPKTSSSKPSSLKPKTTHSSRLPWWAIVAAFMVIAGVTAWWVGYVMPYNGHEAVDMGVSVEWAPCNLGASRPSEAGYYLAWGEHSFKIKYTEENHVYYNEESRKLTFLGQDIAGSIYDSVRPTMGGKWRMPTAMEMQELIVNCDTRWTNRDGVEGMLFTSRRTGKELFFPAAGYWDEDEVEEAGEVGMYWTGTACTDDDDTAYSLILEKDEPAMLDDEENDRYIGLTIRPVIKRSEFGLF